MEIPNYDSGNSQQDNFKQLYEYMPKNIFRMLICGGSGCGKTNLLYHMITKPLIYYDQVFLYCKNLEQDKYKNLMKTMNEISKQVGYDVLVSCNDKIIPVNKLENQDLQRVIVFDDFVCEKNQKDLVDYFIQGRHKNCSVIYLSQSFYKTEKDIRLNCSHYCFFDFPSCNERNLISRELDVDKEKYINATKKQYSFLYVDKPMKKIKRNFYGAI